jgi:hypothetical protein
MGDIGRCVSEQGDGASELTATVHHQIEFILDVDHVFRARRPCCSLRPFARACLPAALSPSAVCGCTRACTPRLGSSFRVSWLFYVIGWIFTEGLVAAGADLLRSCL